MHRPAVGDKSEGGGGPGAGNGNLVIASCGVGTFGGAVKFHSILTGLILLLAAVSSQGQITEWPTTVKPGRFLLEMDALSLSIDKEPGFKYTALGVASTFLTTGLTENWDIQVGAELYFSQKIELSGFTERHSGIGDMYVRTKWRFYNEGGSAVAIMPYVKLPTKSDGRGNDSMEGGVIVPWATVLPGDVNVRAMAELDFRRNDADNGYDTYWYVSAAASRQLTKAIGLYGEATFGKSSGSGKTDGRMGGGVTLHVSEDIWWDYAMYKGISKGAADWQHVLRLNWGF